MRVWIKFFNFQSTNCGLMLISGHYMLFFTLFALYQLYHIYRLLNRKCDVQIFIHDLQKRTSEFSEVLQRVNKNPYKALGGSQRKINQNVT